jgi:hypothetical protein
VVGEQLVGRDAEIELGRQTLVEARAGNARVILISGEAGVGKTALARQMVTDAIEAGYFTAIGHSSELGAGVRFAPIRALVRDLARSFEGVPFVSRPVELYQYWHTRPGVELLCYTPEEFDRKRREISIVREAVREGIEL